MLLDPLLSEELENAVAHEDAATLDEQPPSSDPVMTSAAVEDGPSLRPTHEARLARVRTAPVTAHAGSRRARGRDSTSAGDRRLGRRSRGVSFEEATTAWEDPAHVVIIDGSGQDTFLLIGFTNRGRILTVVHVERGERDRIISAWQATENERKIYTKG